MTERIYPEIGHIKLKEITPHILNEFYEKLLKTPHKRNPQKTLSTKTVLEHHRLISTVLAQAEKEMIIPYNAARKATPPKNVSKKAEYYQLEEIEEIKKAIQSESIKWRTLIMVLMISGVRRGEILGLCWKNIDFEKNRIMTELNVLYSVEKGVYIDTLKTDSSERWISMPTEVMTLLQEYKHWQEEEAKRLDGYYINQGFVFCNDNGSPMHPDSVNTHFARFSKRNGLPHMKPHAFRHTMASILLFGGADLVSTSRRLGHAKVTTTADIYSHIIKEADNRNVEIITKTFLSPQ